MKSTIEKALQRQKEAEAAKKAARATEAENAPAEQDLAKSPDDSASTTLENAMAHATESQASDAPAQLVSDTPRARGADKGTPSAGKTLQIDVQRLEELGFVTLSESRRQINEEYREIKRKLLTNAFGPLSSTLPNSNIIMVSSARPSEGKTFTAVNLALSIAAEQDKTVLLVDADVLKPNVLRTFGLEGEKGLMDYLLGEVSDLRDVIYKTNISKLRIVPAGSAHHLSTELLASAIMNETINEFSKRYSDRVVIIDTPPLIGINESAILASFAGQAVIVVEEGRSKMQDIEKSVERLNPEMAIGFVVNKSISTSEADGYYGYGHYGQYGEDREQA